MGNKVLRSGGCAVMASSCLGHGTLSDVEASDSLDSVFDKDEGEGGDSKAASIQG